MSAYATSCDWVQDNSSAVSSDDKTKILAATAEGRMCGDDPREVNPHASTKKTAINYRPIGDLCFDEYGAGLPGRVITSVGSFYAMAAFSKKAQI